MVFQACWTYTATILPFWRQDLPYFTHRSWAESSWSGFSFSRHSKKNFVDFSSFWKIFWTVKKAIFGLLLRPLIRHRYDFIFSCQFVGGTILESKPTFVRHLFGFCKCSKTFHCSRCSRQSGCFQAELQKINIDVEFSFATWFYFKFFSISINITSASVQ